MSRRFGGPFSPRGDNPAGVPRTGPPKGRPPGPPPRRSKVGLRANLLPIAAIPLFVTGFFREPEALLAYLAAGLLIVAASWLTRQGLLAEEAYEARAVARRPAFPRKMAGSLLVGLGIFTAAFASGQPLVIPALLGALGAGLHLMAFGPDPMKDKGVEGVDSFQTDRVARAVDEAERHLAAMSEAIARVNDRGLAGRVDRFQATARAMFRQVEQDPRDLTAARRYLGVYLLGARDATTKFADLYLRTGDAKARSDYEALLDDLEKQFAARTERLLVDDRTNLDIEIEVLRERLARDGVQTR